MRKEGCAVRTPFFNAEMRQHVPRRMRRAMIKPEPLVDDVIRALARGARELTCPRTLVAGYRMRALAPAFMRRQILRVTGRTGTRR